MGYNSYGYLSTISAGGAVRYTITGMNAREQLTAATYGSNLTATFGHDVYGYPSSTKTGTVQDYSYIFNPITGNLTSRKNELRNLSESFSYDIDGKGLDRLNKVTGPQTLDMTYADNGNINIKSDIDATTAFSYGVNAGPYALTGVSSSNGVVPAYPQTISYNSLQKISSINEESASQTINAFFTYNSDNQRAKMFVGVYYGAEILTRYYVGGSYMKEILPYNSNEYTYLGGDAYTAPVVVHNARGVVSYYYLLRDHLGNITHQVNTSNAVVAEYSFDAWGRRRNATNWSYTLDANDKVLFADRGFTGHEYLPWFKLYNMNGRLYDPAVGRFLSADPFVQDPGNTQHYNRYTYCSNNPLRYTDPSGYTQAEMWTAGMSQQMLADLGGWATAMGYSVNNSNGSSSGDWYSAYRQASIKGYTGGAIDFLHNVYDQQVYSQSYNGTITVSVEAGRQLDWTTKNGERYLRGVKIYYDKIIINVSGQGGQTNWGLYVTGAVLTAEDIYNNFYHNHSTYTTLGGEVKNIYKANGVVRSARAAQFAHTSTAVKVLGTTGTALMTATAGYNIATGNGTVLDYGDATVGATGLTAGAVTWTTGYAIPVVGEGVALYSWARLWFDLGTNYGPSKWYGNDDFRWFK